MRKWIKNLLVKKGDIIVFESNGVIHDMGTVIKNDRVLEEFEYESLTPKTWSFCWLGYKYSRKATREEYLRWLLEC